MNTLELFADFQSLEPVKATELVRGWAAEDRTGLLIQRATFVLSAAVPDVAPALPRRWSVVSTPRPGFWDAALESAGQQGRAALVLLAGIQPSLDAAGLLLHVVDEDPMFGAAGARAQCEQGCCTQPISSTNGTDGSAREWLPTRALHHLPQREIPGDTASPCLVIRPELLTEFSSRDRPLQSLHATVLHRLAAARRCGFRTVLANRALTRLAGADCRKPPSRLPGLPPEDLQRVRPLLDDEVRVYQEFRGRSMALYERFLGRHLAVVERRARPSLLLDMRNVDATYNGTAFAGLGAAWGLYQTGKDWDVAILANRVGSEFHGLQSRFPDWSVYTALPPSGFTAALRLSQPWNIQEMIDLHCLARVNAALMLDTINWDIVYAAPAHLDATWDFLASAADGLLFISEFSRSRFRNRFPHSAQTIHEVCHLSFDPRDYTRPECLQAPTGEHILVIGNQLDHKDVAPTVDLLASAFPFVPIEALGGIRSRSPRVRTHLSGNLAEPDAHRLYSGAHLAVFPSFYEGFGFPTITALAYGRPLVMRASALLDEIAPYCPVEGRLITYTRRSELIDRVGRLLHGEPVPNQPTGLALDGHTQRGWCDVGRDILRFIDTLAAKSTPEDWRRRERTVQHLLAFRG